jgi:hypothetical protein
MTHMTHMTHFSIEGCCARAHVGVHKRMRHCETCVMVGLLSFQWLSCPRPMTHSSPVRHYGLKTRENSQTRPQSFQRLKSIVRCENSPVAPLTFAGSAWPARHPLLSSRGFQ